MATSSSTPRDSPSSDDENERIKKLYPAVNEKFNKLPRSWSPKDKYSYIGLSQNNLRVHYKGVGKTPKDAASVRATDPIPASCGIFYFEVKIISKGRDGYMGIGLSAQGVDMNRLPGWDENSYGYHGDDGNSFCSCGSGQPYGPTFTTGDTIGCCVNLVDNTCFYTKNGISLGVAFKDLPFAKTPLYPTVGLQTPGEVVEANFGQLPFVFDIEDYLKEWKTKTKLTIERFPVSDRKGEFRLALNKIVSTYLVHHGYCSAAEAFCKATDQPVAENIESIRNRQRIQKLVLAGRMGEAIETTQSLYPRLLEHNPNLLFMLKCRQFVEMVNGTDSEVRAGSSSLRPPRSLPSDPSNSRPGSRPATPTAHFLAHQSPRPRHSPANSAYTSPARSPSHSSGGGGVKTPVGRQSPAFLPQQQQQNAERSQMQQSFSNGDASVNNSQASQEAMLNSVNAAATDRHITNGSSGGPKFIDSEDMDLSDEVEHSSAISNGNSHMNGNGVHHANDDDEDMDTDASVQRRLCGGDEAAIEKMLIFGRELKMMSKRLRRIHGYSYSNQKALEDAFSLLAYADPWASPIGGQLLPVQREPVCAALNSAILESCGLPRQPPLELSLAQARQCVGLMAHRGLPAAAFAPLSSYLS